MARILQTTQARLDLIEIGSYISQENPAAADRLLDAIDEKCRLLADAPKLGRARDELAPALRSFPVGHHHIFYRPLPDGIEVIRLLHAARDLDRLF